MVIQGVQLKSTDAERRFSSWLTTQPNAQGRPYKAYVANRYAACLRTEPLKLDIPFSAEDRNVYCCRTLQAFDRLNQIFRTAPNFQEVDRGSGHGAFSAGMAAYRRYVRYLESGAEETVGIDSTQCSCQFPSDVSSEVRRVDFDCPDACTGCEPVSCMVEGKIFSVQNWRDILIEFTEYFLATKPNAKELTWRSVYQRGNRPFLLKNKPDNYASARQISNGYWVYLNLSISNLVFTIGRLCEFCGVALKDVDIQYRLKNTTATSMSLAASGNRYESSKRLDTAIPDAILNVLRNTYSGGFRFEATAITLLVSASGMQIDERLKTNLRRSMFGRKDGVFFLPDQITDEKTQTDLLAATDAYLREYGCFEPLEVYRQFEHQLNTICIKTAEDFEDYYLWVAQKNVRCVVAPQVGNRIVRYNSGNAREFFGEVAKKIVTFINEQHYGSCTEEKLNGKFSAFSKDLLEKIIRYYASDQLIRVEINDTICYQSFAALGLPENFSEALSITLERLEEIGLPPSQETLHTALSLSLGVNFKSEFSLPDWDTYRRLIKTYYNGELHREWKNNIFMEVDG